MTPRYPGLRAILAVEPAKAIERTPVGESATILCGDNLEIMRSMPAQSVDLVFTSPPYEKARTYGINYNLSGQAWVDAQVERFVECLRVCRGLVAWNVEGQTRDFQYSAAPALMMADLHRRGVCLRKPPIFHRIGIPGSGGPDWLRNDYEFIVCGTNGGKLPWSDNTAMGHPPLWGPGGEMSNRMGDGARVNQWGKAGSPRGMGNKDANGNVESGVRPSHKTVRPGTGQNLKGGLAADGWTKSASPMKPDGSRDDQTYVVPVIANPGNVIKCNVGGGAMGSDLAHEGEAPFPEDLVEPFIRSFCPPGGTVLDPHIGTGTTAKVALKWGRNAIGIDIRESQCELTRKRLALEAPALFTKPASACLSLAAGENNKGATT